MDKVNFRRRTLFGATALTAIAAPMILRPGSAYAQEGAKPMSQPQTTPAGQANSIKLGDFTVTVISDGIRVAENPNETFGIDQPKDAVAALLEQNFLPSDKFANGFSPVVVDTGSAVVLFDTGFGEAGREAGNGQLIKGLADAGYSPDSITHVVLTHMHGDHIGGLMEGGKPAFPKAAIIAGEVEYAFWTDPARAGTPAEGNQKAVMASVVPLKDKITFIKEGAKVVPGITGIEAFGHSPGHMIFRVSSAGKDLMLTADTANHYVLSLQKPDWQVRFDMDKDKATATRRKVFDMIAAERLPFIGYHMPYPSLGYVEKAGEGYRFIPASYQFYL